MNNTAIGVALALLSSVTTAIAHGFLKAGKDKLAVRAILNAVGTSIALPVCFFVPLPTSAMLPWLIAASSLHTVYQFVLIRSYAANDFSVAYPISRGMAPIATAVLGVVFLADRITPIGLTGVMVVSAGILLIAIGRSIALHGLIAAAVAGLLTTAYTLVDAHAVRLAPIALTFVAWFFLLDGLIMVPIFVALRGRRAGALVRAEGLQGIVAGLVTQICFGSALFALRFAPVGVVSALRETSVVFGMATAALMLREQIDRQRLIGASIIAAGAMLIVSAYA